MLKSKQGSGKRLEGDNAILFRAMRKVISDKVTFEQRSEQSDGVRYAGV